MSYVQYTDFIGTCATVSTIGLFLVGTKICHTFIKTKTTGDASPMSFLTGVVMTFVWCNYGVLKGDRSLKIVNGTGFILQSSYLICFYIYAASKARILKQITAVCGCLGVVTLYMMMSTDTDAVINNLGLFAASMSVAYCGAPLASINQVLKTKSTEVLPFSLILVTALVMGQWTVYGYLVDDIYVLFPNLLGFLLALMQLSLFLYFPSYTSYTKQDVFIS